MTDRYTKAALTVIAAALIALVAERYVKPLHAAGGAQRVVICDASNTEHCAALAGVDVVQERYGLTVVTRNAIR